MPWQRMVWDVALEIDAVSGELAYNEVVVICGRQQGKTELLMPAMTHRCLGFEQLGPQRVLYTTQTADKAREKWRDIHLERLARSPYAGLFTPRKRLNAEAMIWRNGSMWSPGSTTGKTGGTGDTLDLGVIDEAWTRPDGRTELGMRPAMMTRRQRQLWVASMMPGPTRLAEGRSTAHVPAYLRAKRAAGRARVDADVREGVAFFDFAAADGLPAGDPDTWWSCMPALGYMVDERTIRQDFEAMSEADFDAEYLGREQETGTPQWLAVSREVWASRRDADSQMVDPVALGAACDPDQSVGSIAAVGLRADGDLHVELIDRRAGVAWMPARLVELAERVYPCAIGVDPAGPEVALIEPTRRALTEAGLAFGLPLITPTGTEVMAACGRLFTATGQVEPDAPPLDEAGVEVPLRMLWHLGQAELDTAVAACIKRPVMDRWRWARTGTAADVAPMAAVTSAYAAGESQEWLGGSYDIAASLG